MKTRFTNHFFLHALVITGFILLSAQGFAQQQTEDNTKKQKTITIHVTKVEDGKTVVIDTTVIDDGDFDADAYLSGKGVLKDIPENGRNIEKEIIIRHPEMQGYEQSGRDDNSPDTIIIDTDREYALNDQFDLDIPPMPDNPDMPFGYFQYEYPHGFSHLNGPHMDAILRELANSIGLSEVMPFGDMKQVVVKKKRNGKKVIITFEDREKSLGEHGKKQEEKVIILKDNSTGMAPHHEERVIIQGDPGEGTTMEKDVEKTAPAKQQTKVIIIKEEKTK